MKGYIHFELILLDQVKLVLSNFLQDVNSCSTLKHTRGNKDFDQRKKFTCKYDESGSLNKPIKLKVGKNKENSGGTRLTLLTNEYNKQNKNSLFYFLDFTQKKYFCGKNFKINSERFDSLIQLHKY